MNVTIDQSLTDPGNLGTSDDNIKLKNPLNKKTMEVGSPSLFVLDFPGISVYIRIQTV